MIFTPRKKIITSRFRQRGNIVSFAEPLTPPVDALGYFLNEIGNANPGGGSGTRLDVFWRQTGLQVWTAKQGGTIRQYDVSPAWSIVGSPSDWSLDFETAAIGDLRTIWWNANGTLFSHCRRVPATSFRITTFDQSATPFDITVLGASTTKQVDPTGGATPQDHFWSEDGLRLWVKSGLDTRIDEYTVTVAFDASTIVNAQVKTAVVPSNDTVTFSPDGTKLYMMRSQILNSMDMSVPFDIDTLNNLSVGPSVPAANVTIPRGINFRADNEDIFVAGDQNQRRCAFFRVTPPPPTGVIVVGAGVAYGQVLGVGATVFTLPAHNAGDVLLLAHYIAKTDDVLDTVLVSTAGWVELAAAERRVFSGSASTQRVWTKIGDGVETQVTINNTGAGGSTFSLACVAIDGVDAVDIFDPTPLTSHSKLQNNSSNPTAVALTSAFDGQVMFLFCGHSRTFTTYAPPTGYADNAKNSFSGATIYACSKKVTVAGLETPGAWNTTGVNAGADNLLMSVMLKPEP